MSSGGRGLAPDRAVAHHVDAQRQMRDLRADVDCALPAIELVHVLREGLPLPVQPGGEHRIGDFLDALHQVHQRAVMFLLHRREADAAIAEHHRGDAMPARGREQRVPHRLPIVMGVHVDPAGRHQQSIGVDLAPRRPLLAADRRDPAAGYRDVAGEGGRARPVDDAAAANDDVVHGELPGWRRRNDAPGKGRGQWVTKEPGCAFRAWLACGSRGRRGSPIAWPPSRAPCRRYRSIPWRRRRLPASASP